LSIQEADSEKPIQEAEKPTSQAAKQPSSQAAKERWASQSAFGVSAFRRLAVGRWRLAVGGAQLPSWLLGFLTSWLLGFSELV
jgi:hypothetical protein